jgi:hypothetical protein
LSGNCSHCWIGGKNFRSLIEDLFKLGKDTFSLRALHRYSRLAVVKFVALNVLLIGTVVLAGVNQKNIIQRVAEW